MCKNNLESIFYRAEYRFFKSSIKILIFFSVYAVDLTPISLQMIIALNSKTSKPTQEVSLLLKTIVLDQLEGKCLHLFFKKIINVVCIFCDSAQNMSTSQNIHKFVEKLQTFNKLVNIW